MDINWTDGGLGTQLWQLHNELDREADSTRKKKQKQSDSSKSEPWRSDSRFTFADDENDFDDEYEDDGFDDEELDDEDDDNASGRAATCKDCVFWDSDGHHIREECCKIWYWVDFNCDVEWNTGCGLPEEDKWTCEKFQQNVGFAGTCYDCVHWASDNLLDDREDGCKSWSKVMADYRGLRRRMEEEFYSSLALPEADPWSPYSDRGKWICLRFKRNKRLEPGHGQACVKKAWTLFS